VGVTVVANAVLFGLMAFLQRPAEKPPLRLLQSTLDVAVVRKSLPKPLRPQPKRLPARRPEPKERLRVARVRPRTTVPRLTPRLRRAAIAAVPRVTELQPLAAVAELAVPTVLAPPPSDPTPTRREPLTGPRGPGRAVYTLGEVDRPPERTVYVAPVYPAAARRRGLAGWVSLVFVVTREGRVEDVVVVDAEGGRRFEAPAVRAVRRWKFRPGRLEGEAVPVRCTVKINFRLEE
jgi:protein TonB